MTRHFLPSRLGALLLPAFVSLGLAIGHVSAAPQTSHAKTEHVQASLITSAQAVLPGDKIYAGIRMKIIPHWHIYWKNPGDSGVATSIAWDLPEGASAEEILWPTPERFRIGPVVNYGYSGDVTLLSLITIPSSMARGGYFPISAKVDWLVCREECIPQQVRLNIVLPVISAGQSHEKPNQHIERVKTTLPEVIPWPVKIAQDNTRVKMSIKIPEQISKSLEEVWFYPDKWGAIAHNAPQTFHEDKDGSHLSIPLGESPLTPGSRMNGVLVTKTNESGLIRAKGYHISLPLEALPATTNEENSSGLLLALAMAFLGGIILNLMPCVFPVLSIKALSILKHGQASEQEVRSQGLAYCLGVLLSFAVLGGLLIALKETGTNAGWGFQFQSPSFTVTVAYLMFAVGLNLSGVFAIGNPFANTGSSLAEKSGHAGSFFTGALATLVATPCTAPFMGAAVGYAITQPASTLMAVFMTLGTGFSFPLMLLSIRPSLSRRLPKPGLWMEHLKQFLAFPMYASAVWLVWVLAQQADLDALIVALGGMVLIAFAAWLYNLALNCTCKIRPYAMTLAILTPLAVLIGGLGITPSIHNTTAAPTEKQIWEPYSPDRLQDLRSEGKPVFLNFTAAWCITCLVNERLTLDTDFVRNILKDSGTIYLKADWTNQNPRISEKLAEFGRSGVPLYVYYPPGISSKPLLLPQILTPDIVKQAIYGNTDF